MTGKKLLGPDRWTRSGTYDRCRHCGRNDRPHEALGLCCNCHAYHKDPERARLRRKANRLKNDTVAKQYPKVRAWHEKNADRVREYKRRYHLRHNPPKYPVGITVWYQLAGFWCEGVVESRPTNCTIVVRLKGGTVVKTAARWLRRSNPYAREAA